MTYHSADLNKWLTQTRLTEWWESAFEIDERDLIERMFYDSIAYYENGGFGRVNRLDLLEAIGHAILRCNEYHLHEPVLQKIDEVARARKAYFDLHLYYSGLITRYYRVRNTETDALAQAISLCEKQIALGPLVIQEIVDK